MKAGDLVTHKMLGFGVVIEVETLKIPTKPNFATTPRKICLVYWEKQNKASWVQLSKIELLNESR